MNLTGDPYDKSGRDERALELRKYNVGRFPNDKYAMWSQVRIFHSLMAKGDDSGADAAVEKLLGVFSEQATLPREIHQIGGAYVKAKRRDRALELWNYNVENHPNDKFAMWSQVRTVYSHIEDGNDTAADTAAGRLLSVFSEEPTLSREIRQVAKRFGRAGMAGKSVDLHTYNVDNFPKSEEAMASQLDIVDYYLDDANDPNAAAMAADRLVSVFSEQEGLAGKVYEIAGRLAKAGRADDAIGVYEYNVENSAEDANGLLSQVEIVYINIDKKDAAGIDAAVDTSGQLGRCVLIEYAERKEVFAEANTDDTRNSTVFRLKQQRLAVVFPCLSATKRIFDNLYCERRQEMRTPKKVLVALSVCLLLAGWLLIPLLQPFHVGPFYFPPHLLTKGENKTTLLKFTERILHYQ